MLLKYKKIYQTLDETVSETCVEFSFVTYLPPSGICVDNQANLNFNYIDCAGNPQIVSYLITCDAGIYEPLSPLCVRDGSVVPFGAGSASVTSIGYGAPC